MINGTTVLGEYAVGFNTAGRISNLNVQNTVSPFTFFEGYNSTFTYDGQGNCTLIELKDIQGRVLSRTVYSDFVAIRSVVTKFKNQYINPYTASITENLQYALPYNFPNTSPNKIEVYSALNANGTYKGILSKNAEYSYQRTANPNGTPAQRTVTNPNGTSSTTTYEYSGCN